MQRIIIILAALIILMSCAVQEPVKQDVKAEPTAEPSPTWFLNSSEYKLLLNPEYFQDYTQGFAQYWEIVKEVAAEQGIAVLESEKPLKLGHKQVSFWDTEDLALRKNSFLLRRKSSYKDGALAKKYKELVAVGISIVMNCESCLEWHIKQALDDGASQKEILEAIEVGIEMSGGPGTVSARFAMAVLEYYSQP